MSFVFTLPETILRLIDDAILVKYFHVASVSLMAYDYLIMLPDEIRYIWATRWHSNWGMLFYFLTRYLAFVDASILTAFLFDPRIPLDVSELCLFFFFSVLPSELIRTRIRVVRLYTRSLLVSRF